MIDIANAIFKAAQEGSAQLLRSLLARIQNADLRDAYGNTPLMMAASLGRFEAVTVLLEHGCDVNAVNIEKQTALHLAAKSGWHYAMAALMRSRTIDIDRVNHLRRSALHEAVEARSLACVRLLINGRANTNCCDHEGRSPLHFAAHYGDLEILNLIMPLSRINAQDANLRTALVHAACVGPITSLQALLHAGANTSVTDDVGRNALDWAVALGRSEHIHMLNAAGAVMSIAALDTCGDDSLEIPDSTPARLAGQTNRRSTRRADRRL